MAGEFVGRRVVFTGPGKIEVAEWSVDAPGPGEVVVRAEKTLISPGTEMSRAFDTHRAQRGYPTNTGYLAVGRIAAMGEGVESWQVDDRVLLSMGHIGYVRADAGRPMMFVPDEVASEKAVYTHLATISLRGVRLGQIEPGRGALVLGQGLIGLFATYFAKRLGAVPVMALDLWPKRLELAEKFGADLTLVPPRERFTEVVREWIGDDLPPVVVDATGTPRVISSCPKFAADDGRMVVLGGVHKDVTFDLYTDFQKRNLQLRGCGHASPASGTGREEENALMCLDLICRGELDVARLTTHIVSIDEASKMYHMLRDEPEQALGVVFDWTKE